MVPAWPAKAWWRLFVPDADGFFHPAVCAVKVLAPRPGLILTVDKHGNRAPRSQDNYSFVVLLVDFASARDARLAVPSALL
jgi:hypothetical protein